MAARSIHRRLCVHIRLIQVLLRIFFKVITFVKMLIIHTVYIGKFEIPVPLQDRMNWLRRNDSPKLAETTQGRNDSGRNDPGRNVSRPKRLKAETTNDPLPMHAHDYKEGTSRQRSGKCSIRKRFPLQKPRWEKN